MCFPQSQRSACNARGGGAPRPAKWFPLLTSQQGRSPLKSEPQRATWPLQMVSMKMSDRPTDDLPVKFEQPEVARVSTNLHGPHQGWVHFSHGLDVKSVAEVRIPTAQLRGRLQGIFWLGDFAGQWAGQPAVPRGRCPKSGPLTPLCVSPPQEPRGSLWGLNPSCHRGDKPLTATVSFLLLPVSLLSPTFSASTSQINYMHPNPCLRVCFWGTQTKTGFQRGPSPHWPISAEAKWQ